MNRSECEDDIFGCDSGDYRKVIFDSYLSAFGNPSIEVLRDQLAVRAHHCGWVIRNFFPADCDARILDLGCGYGALEYYAAQAGYANIRGVDRSVEQLDASRRLGIANISQGDCFERNQVSDAANRS
jgi:SAM-dependent methyltransferase